MKKKTGISTTSKLINDGYYDNKFKPKKCVYCSHNEFIESEEYKRNDLGIIVSDLFCNKCNKIIGAKISNKYYITYDVLSIYKNNNES